MNEDKTIEHLLEQVSTISKKYKDIAKITGENFNIFHILNMASDEVGLHSRLIGELLNPKGSHDQGAMFLQLFLEECGLLEFVEGTDLDFTKVAIEESIGRIGGNHEEGGRIDLVLKFNNGKFIVIENKIYAVDQPNQLLRYKKAYPTAKIMYINLGGKDEITKDISGLKVDEFIWISYKNEILNWLVKSTKEAYGLPNIQYIFDHYIKIIQYLTNQNTNKNMNDEMNDKILLSEENLKAAFYIKNNYSNLKKQVAKILEEQLVKVFEKIKEKYKLESFIDKNFGNKNTSAGVEFSFSSNEFRFFVFFLSDLNDLFIGIKAKDEKIQPNISVNTEINKKISLNSHKDSFKWHYGWMQKEEFMYFNFDSPKVLFEINNGNSEKEIFIIFDKVLSEIFSGS